MSNVGTGGTATINDNDVITVEAIRKEESYKGSEWGVGAGGYYKDFNQDRDVSENTSRNTGTDSTRTTDLLGACKQPLENLTKALNQRFISDPLYNTCRPALIAKAKEICDAASAYEATADAELDSLFNAQEQDYEAEICVNEDQWARTAGSSRNCYVQHHKSHHKALLAHRLAGLRADFKIKTAASQFNYMQIAFNAKFQACATTYDMEFDNMLGVWGLLRGAMTSDTLAQTGTDTFNRSLNEDLDSREFNINTQFNYGKKAGTTTNTTAAFDAEQTAIDELGSGLGSPLIGLPAGAP